MIFCPRSSSEEPRRRILEMFVRPEERLHLRLCEPAGADKLMLDGARDDLVLGFRQGVPWRKQRRWSVLTRCSTWVPTLITVEAR